MPGIRPCAKSRSNDNHSVLTFPLPLLKFTFSPVIQTDWADYCPMIKHCRWCACPCKSSLTMGSRKEQVINQFNHMLDKWVQFLLIVNTKEQNMIKRVESRPVHRHCPSFTTGSNIKLGFSNATLAFMEIIQTQTLLLHVQFFFISPQVNKSFRWWDSLKQFNWAIDPWAFLIFHIPNITDWSRK